MTQPDRQIHLLLVDDEAGFRQAAGRALSRRGFRISEAESGERALELLGELRPDLVILDLKMGGMDGISALKEIRRIDEKLPVLILTGHGRYLDALAGISLEIVDFVQKPVDMELLGARIRKLLIRDSGRPLRERTVRELMVSVTSYERVYADQTLREALEILRAPEAAGDEQGRGLCSVLVFDRGDRFVGMLGLQQVLEASIPAFLASSAYSSYFTGMFLAQTKILGGEQVGDLLGEPQTIEIEAPLMEAVHCMVSGRSTALPVVDNGELVGVLRDRDLLQEIAISVIGGEGETA